MDAAKSGTEASRPKVGCSSFPYTIMFTHRFCRRAYFLCVLAYHLLVAIETTLLSQGLHTTWATVRDTLATN